MPSWSLPSFCLPSAHQSAHGALWPLAQDIALRPASPTARPSPPCSNRLCCSSALSSQLGKRKGQASPKARRPSHPARLAPRPGAPRPAPPLPALNGGREGLGAPREPEQWPRGAPCSHAHAAGCPGLVAGGRQWGCSSSCLLMGESTAARRAERHEADISGACWGPGRQAAPPKGSRLGKWGERADCQSPPRHDASPARLASPVLAPAAPELVADAACERGGPRIAALGRARAQASEANGAVGAHASKLLSLRPPNFKANGGSDAAASSL